MAVSSDAHSATKIAEVMPRSWTAGRLRALDHEQHARALQQPDRRRDRADLQQHHGRMAPVLPSWKRSYRSATRAGRNRVRCAPEVAQHHDEDDQGGHQTNPARNRASTSGAVPAAEAPEAGRQGQREDEDDVRDALQEDRCPPSARRRPRRWPAAGRRGTGRPAWPAPGSSRTSDRNRISVASPYRTCVPTFRSTSHQRRLRSGKVR